MARHAVDEVEDGGGLAQRTQAEAALLPLVPPAVRCWRSAALHPPEGSVRDGAAAIPRLVHPPPQNRIYFDAVESEEHTPATHRQSTVSSVSEGVDHA